MEATPALRNNWEFATAPSPEAVLMNGLAPIQNAVQSYNQRQFQGNEAALQRGFEAQQQQLAEQNAMRLQQLKVASVARAMQARDATLLAREAQADAARLNAATVAEKARQDQETMRGINDRIKQLVTIGESYGMSKFPTLPVNADGSAPTAAALTQYANELGTQVDAAKQQGIAGLVPQFYNNLSQHDQIISDMQRKFAGSYGQAQQMALGDNPPSKWVLENAAPDSAEYKAVQANPAVAAQVLKQSGLFNQYMEYVQAQIPKYQAAYIAREDPQAGQRFATLLKDNEDARRAMMTGSKGQQNPLALDASALAFKQYAQDKYKRDLELDNQSATATGVEPNPTQAAQKTAAQLVPTAAALKSAVRETAPKPSASGPVTLQNSGVIGVGARDVGDFLSRVGSNVSDALGLPTWNLSTPQQIDSYMAANPNLAPATRDALLQRKAQWQAAGTLNPLQNLGTSEMLAKDFLVGTSGAPLPLPANHLSAPAARPVAVVAPAPVLQMAAPPVYRAPAGGMSPDAVLGSLPVISPITSGFQTGVPSGTDEMVQALMSPYAQAASMSELSQ